MIEFYSKGSFAKTEAYLRKLQQGDFYSVLDKYGQEGVRALAAATPTESGETANSWSYKINKKGRSVSIVWSNSHIEKGANVAVLIQYGHGTGTGGYVQGRDYINPAIQPIFDRILNDVLKAVRSA